MIQLTVTDYGTVIVYLVALVFYTCILCFIAVVLDSSKLLIVVSVVGVAIVIIAVIAIAYFRWRTHVLQKKLNRNAGNIPYLTIIILLEN